MLWIVRLVIQITKDLIKQAIVEWLTLVDGLHKVAFALFFSSDIFFMFLAGI
jgi:hypothetical protein